MDFRSYNFKTGMKYEPRWCYEEVNGICWHPLVVVGKLKPQNWITYGST